MTAPNALVYNLMGYSNISRNTLTEHKYLAVRIAREKISGSGRRHCDADTAGKIFVAKGRGKLAPECGGKSAGQGRYPVKRRSLHEQAITRVVPRSYSSLILRGVFLFFLGDA